jgi:coenzyme F420-reducing hydrogenase alpha subunit
MAENCLFLDRKLSYGFNDAGYVTAARIITPTALNLAVAEADLNALAARYGRLPRKELTWLCEQAIRYYNPFISCATH